jgi:hypothetical protein
MAHSPDRIAPMTTKPPPANPRDKRLAEALKRNIGRRKAAQKPDQSKK